MRREYNISDINPTEDYTILNCIISNGTQAIDTLFYPTNNTSVECDMNLLSNANKPYPVACYDLNNRRGYFIGCETPYIAMGYGGVAFINTYITFPINSRNVLKASFSNGRQTMEKNGSVIYTSTYTGTFSLNTTLSVFALKKKNNGYDQYAKMKLYSLKIYDNSILVRNYVPAMKNSDGTIGLLDTLSNTFYQDVKNKTFDYEK